MQQTTTTEVLTIKTSIWFLLISILIHQLSTRVMRPCQILNLRIAVLKLKQLFYTGQPQIVNMGEMPVVTFQVMGALNPIGPQTRLN